MENRRRLSLSVLSLFVCFLSFFGSQRSFATPLDDYVHTPDPTYSWKLNSTFRGLGYTAYVIDLTSQTWMSIQQSDSPVWRHWLTLCVPLDLDKKHADHAFIYVDGGHTNDPAPTSVDALAEVVCLGSRTVSAALTQIPNEPIVFTGDGKRRSEDAIIAYTWSHFINNTKEPIWLLRLPMVKAVVRAMDTIQDFAAENLPQVPKIEKFVVAGASKRGWTTWLTGAVDSRVAAMVPMVMPILNIVPNMNHHYQAYGGWSFALDDYLKMGLMAYLNQPQFVDLANVVDPWVYRDRLTMPKLVLTAAGDEFFLPDSPQFFMSGLKGESHLTVIPDAEHSLATALLEVGDTINSFYHLIITGTQRPSFTYEIIKSNTTASIVVQTDPTLPGPSQVTMWWAYTIDPVLRDFRLVICPQLPECINPVLWFPKTLKEVTPGSGKYVATMNKPSSGHGYGGFLIELTYVYGQSPKIRQLRLSTEINIVPDKMPFPPCGDHCQ